MLTNTEVLVRLNLKLSEKILKLSKNEQLTENEIEETKIINDELTKYVQERSFKNKKDLEFFKK